MKFTVHCLVKNEDIWVKSAIESVLPFAHKVLIFDTGSNDQTEVIIRSIKSPKITFEKKGGIDREGLVRFRQEMIDRTNTPWFLIVDGDEIWPSKQLEKLLNVGDKAPTNVVGVFNSIRNCVGDVYHYLPESFGNYQLGGKRGNLSLRLMKKTSTMHMEGTYPLETWTDINGPVQGQDKNLIYADCWYLHTSYLKRSSSDISKRSGSFAKSKIWEKGILLKKEELPEILRGLEENAIQLQKRGSIYEFGSHFTSPAISLKRKFR